MKILKKVLIAAALCTGASAATAQVSWLINGLFPSPEGGILIDSPETVNGLNCVGASGGNNVLLPASHANYNQTYATLLTAFVSGNDVQLRIDTNASQCTLFFTRIL